MAAMRAVLPALAGLTLCCTLGAGRAQAATAPLVVMTQQGPIQGSVVSGNHRFAGVRYAAPPVGALRWMPPAAAPVHAGLVSATQFGSQCPQATGTYSSPDEGGSEDCLFLNITTPAATPAQPAPVMVFIHGGSFVSGEGATYVPSTLVTQTGVVVVTINYRLGLLGALALPQLDAEAPQYGSGDYAVLDQQAALAWVKANIAAFGGDPGRVTVWGESAGAEYVCQNVTSPFAAGLFKGAIAESGCSIPAPSKAQAEAFGAAVAAALNCDGGGQPDLTCLRAQTPLAITNAAIAVEGGDISQSEFASVPDNGTPTLPLPVLAAFQSGGFNRVPLLVGSNLYEGRLFVYGNSAGPIPSTASVYDSDISTYVTPNTGAPVSAVVGAYPPNLDGSIAYTYSAVVGDSLISCNTAFSNQLAGEAPYAVPIYGYEFTDSQAPNAIIIPLGATHTSELFFLFDLGYPLRPDEHSLARTMKAYWANFAAAQNPNKAGLASWPAYASSASLPLLNLNIGTLKTLSTSSFDTDHQCSFWQPYLAPELSP
jgi:para-nitrobenzyl esterase